MRFKCNTFCTKVGTAYICLAIFRFELGANRDTKRFASHFLHPLTLFEGFPLLQFKIQHYKSFFIVLRGL